MPQASIDPVVMAEAAVVTLGSLQAGTQENIILDEAVIKLNVGRVPAGAAGVIEAEGSEDVGL